MTREEAIKILSNNEMIDVMWDKADEALNMAIDALEQQPCEDCISRQAVIDACDQSINLFEAVDRIKELPPVTPQPKTGHWILTDDDFVYCSECEDSYYPIPIDASWYYCPHCGAKMVEPQESEG